MKRLLIGFLLTWGSFQALALTPFSLNGVKEVTVHVADYSGLYDDKMKKTLEALMRKYMKSLGIQSDKFYSESLILLLKSDVIGGVKVLYADLMITGDVSRANENHFTFGVTYLNKDSVEIEDTHEDLIDSVSFLLEEFKDQYIQDNEE